MTEIDRHTTTDLVEKLGLSIHALFGLHVFFFMTWALLSPEVALPSSLLALLLVNLILGAVAAIGNTLTRSRALAFQDAVCVMVHANSLHMPPGSSHYPSGSIDDALRQTDAKFEEARISAERGDRSDFATRMAGFAQAVVAQFILLALAGACGVYFSADVAEGLAWAVAQVQSVH